MGLKLEALKITRAFYNVELGRENLTERERDKYLKAKKLIEKIIGEKEKVGERRYRVKDRGRIRKYQKQQLVQL